MVYIGADKPAGTWVTEVSWDDPMTVTVTVRGAHYQRPSERQSVSLTTDVDQAQRQRFCWDGQQQFEYVLSVSTSAAGAVRLRTWPPN